MDSGTAVDSLQDEASCSICLQYFQDPVSIHCGHNFCRACITQNWEESDANFSCPRCNETAQQRNFRPNRELAKIIEIAKQLSLHAARGATGGEKVCEKHRESLKLFCEEDHTPICLICRESQAHKAHPVVPIEEAAQDYKEKFRVRLQVLKDEREKLLGKRQTEEKRSHDFLEDLETEKVKIMCEMEELHHFVHEQERLLVARLDDLQEKIVRRRDERVARFSEDIACLDDLIAELEEKCQQPAVEFLQDCRSILSRWEEKIPEPLETSLELEEKISSFTEANIDLEEMRRDFQVNLTLDPETAHPRLVLSEDWKDVRWEDTRRQVLDNPKRFDSSRCVLGCEGFSSGKYYWEVEVLDEGAWAVGVAKESVRRKGRMNINPEEGIWAVGKCENRYQALTTPVTLLPLVESLRVIGIYVDYEEGQVVFFNGNYEAPIFTYSPASFMGERILPLLCLGRKTHFRLCP